MSAIQATARLNLVAAAEVGSGGTSAWQLETAWSWAPWATLLLVAFCVGWVAYFYARESPTASPGLRALFAMAFLLMGGFVTIYNYASFRLLGAPYALSHTAVGAIFMVTCSASAPPPGSGGWPIATAAAACY